MAEVTVRLADVEEFRLFVWELRMLADDMRVSASPYTERLERALDRFTDEPDAVGEGEGVKPDFPESWPEASLNVAPTGTPTVRRCSGCGPEGREFESRRARHTERETPYVSPSRGSNRDSNECDCTYCVWGVRDGFGHDDGPGPVMRLRERELRNGDAHP